LGCAESVICFDLSPWGDERPQDDPDQRLGLDLETYRLVLSETQRQATGREMTEVSGFFAFSKYANMPDHRSAHEPVPTEWETVWLMSPYSCYQNTVASDCYNQSFHARHRVGPPAASRRAESPARGKGVSLHPDGGLRLGDASVRFSPQSLGQRDRGSIPFAWGINPNLLETYPDLIAYFYSTATLADTFTADPSAAGYMNPNRVGRNTSPSS
jgi:hypothetical protein